MREIGTLPWELVTRGLVWSHSPSMAKQALIVCGENSVAHDLAHQAGEIGLRVECTNEIRFVPTLLKRQNFDVIVVDCDGQGGLELVELVRHRSPDQKAVLLALVTGVDTARRATQIGADFILQKPLESEMTRKALRAAQTMSIRESRSSIRESVHSHATLRIGDHLSEGVVVDLSESGLGLECAQTVEIGKQLQIEFSLPGCDRQVRCTGKVVRVEAGRLGIHFLYLSASSAEVVMMWLRTNSPRHSVAQT